MNNYTIKYNGCLIYSSKIFIIIDNVNNVY